MPASPSTRGTIWLAWLLFLFAAAPAYAQTFPKLSRRVVDAANLLSPAQEAELTGKLAALETASSRQLVVATVPGLEDFPIEDYGYRLLRSWGIGQKGANNGAILIVAPAERKVRIEVGYGLEPILTDAFSSLVIQNAILPRFKANDYPGGIAAGIDAIVQQLQAPPEQAEERAAEAASKQRPRGSGRNQGGSVLNLIFWGMIFLFVLLPMIRGQGGRGGRGRRFGGSNLPIILWSIANEMSRSGGGRSGGGFGGFGGGGGSGGGGGASGGW